MISSHWRDHFVHASGDGKTPATAYVVVSTREEYALLRILRAQRREPSLIRVARLSVTIPGSPASCASTHEVATSRRLSAIRLIAVA
jgi:hypothetical protein